MSGAGLWRALLLVMTALAVGCSEEGSPAQGEDGTSPGVTGVVARQKTGVGVPGITVAAVAPGGTRAAAVTGPDGSFDTGPLPDGTYEIVPVGLELAGLDPRFDVMEPPRDTVQVSSGEARELVFAVVGIIPARITGEVTCGGQPDAGAVIRVAGGAGTDVEATTDAVGRYAVLDLLPGVYSVFPVSAGCSVAPAYMVMELRPGEFRRADLGG